MNVWPWSLTEDYNILCGVTGLQAFGEGFPDEQEGCHSIVEKTSCFLIFKDTKVGCLPGSVGECVISNGEFEPLTGCSDYLNKYIHLKKKKDTKSSWAS